MSPAPAHRGGDGPERTAAQPGAVAQSIEIVLVAGRAQTTRAGFAPGLPPAQTTLGSGPLAGWRIDARGVEPVHAELAWDGQRLWVRDAGSANGTYVGVERIDAWRALVADDRFALGEATFVVVADETTAPRIADDPRSEGSTRVAPVKPVDVPPDALPRAPSTAEGPHGALDAERTVITESLGTPPVATPAPSAAIRAMGIPPPRLNRPTPGPQTVPPPRRGGYGERSDESTVAISTEGAGGPVVTPFVPDAPAPSATTLSAAPALAPPAAGLARDPFDAPPTPSGLPPGELTSLFGALPPRAPPPPPVTDAAVANLRAGYAALPRRTLALFAMTLVAGIAMLVIVAHKHSVEAREAARDAPPPPRTHAPTTAPAADAYHGTPPLAAPPAGPTGTLLAANPAPVAPPVAPVAPARHGAHRHAAPAPVAALSPDALAEQAAAAALASGHFAEALSQYAALATAHPEAPVYGQLVQILRRKLEALAACSSGATTCAPSR